MLVVRSCLFQVVLILSIALSGVAFAQSQIDFEVIDVVNDWSAIRLPNQSCFATSRPTTSKPEGVNRDPVYFFVTTDPAQDISEEISINIGYPFKKDSEVEIDVDGSVYTFITEDYYAWPKNEAEQPAILDAMRAGRRMVVRGLSSRGTNTTDTYSLLGVTKALQIVKNTCGS